MRLIDADELRAWLVKAGWFLKLQDDKRTASHAIGKIIDHVDKIPTVDAVPVVRCRECEHAERYERIDGTAGYYCGHPQNTFVYGDRWDRVFKPVKKPDDFCSFGEPKEG
jgi:hypothetical protein